MILSLVRNLILFIILSSTYAQATVQVPNYNTKAPVVVCQPNDTNTNCGGGSSGSVSSVSGTAPIVSSGGTTPAISIPKATTSVDGYLSATDFVTFNNKQAAGSYLTSEVDGVIGNEVTNTTDGTLTRSGSGTSGSPYTLGVNLSNANIWAGQQTFVAPILGTPASGVATNFTGTASGLTAGNVTTNANLTGPITSSGNATAVASQTGTGTTFVMQASPTLTTPNLGTPTTLVGTNITGTAASLTAGNVTTNANLTGVITSVGNATSIASQTGTGTKFVVDTSPTLVTPVLGAATGTSLALSGAIGQIGGTTGVSLSAASGVLTLAGIGNTNNENLLFDLESSSNTAKITSGTGVNNITFGSANIRNVGTNGTGVFSVTATLSASTSLYGIQTVMTNSNSGVAAIAGSGSFTSIRSSNTAGNSGVIKGVEGIGQYSGTGTEPDAYGVYGRADKITSATGILTDAYSIYGDTPVASGGGSITNSWAGGFNGNVKILGDLKLSTAGNGIYIKEGSNATMGTGVLVGGTLVVSTTKVTANSRIFLTSEGGTITNLGNLYISARTAGTSFTVTSSNILDTQTFVWLILEPA